MKWMSEEFIKKEGMNGGVTKTTLAFGKRYNELKTANELLELITDIGNEFVDLSEDEQRICGLLDSGFYYLTEYVDNKELTEKNFKLFLENYQKAVEGYNKNRKPGVFPFIAFHNPISLINFKKESAQEKPTKRSNGNGGSRSIKQKDEDKPHDDKDNIDTSSNIDNTVSDAEIVDVTSSEAKPETDTSTDKPTAASDIDISVSIDNTVSDAEIVDVVPSEAKPEADTSANEAKPETNVGTNKPTVKKRPKADS